MFALVFGYNSLFSLITAKVKLEQLKKLSQSSPESLIIYHFPPSHFHWPVSSNPKAALEAGEVPTDSSLSVILKQSIRSAKRI